MEVAVYPSLEALGRAAADDLASHLREMLATQDEAAIIIATGNSQQSFIAELRSLDGIPWDRISVFHMDEYLGISPNDPHSLHRWALDELVNVVHPRAFYGIRGDLQNAEEEVARYAALLEAHPPVACVLGIGENGHLAFNEPPADFHTGSTVRIVTIAPESRKQQVDEGNFVGLDDVPAQAISLTIPALTRTDRVFAVVPEARKAIAVRAALVGPITPNCPASILRTLPHAKLYLDLGSASLLDKQHDLLAQRGSEPSTALGRPRDLE